MKKEFCDICFKETDNNTRLLTKLHRYFEMISTGITIYYSSELCEKCQHKLIVSFEKEIKRIRKEAGKVKK